MGDEMGWRGRAREKLRKGEKERRMMREEKRETNKYEKIMENEEMKKKKGGKGKYREI